MPLPLNFILGLTHDRACSKLGELEFSAMDSDRRPVTPTVEEQEILQAMADDTVRRFYGTPISTPTLHRMANYAAFFLMDHMPGHYAGRFIVYSVDSVDGVELSRRIVTTTELTEEEPHGHDLDR